MAKSRNGIVDGGTEKPERFLPSARYALFMAQVVYEDLHDPLIEPHHLLFGLLHTPGSIAAAILAEFGINQARLLSAIDNYQPSYSQLKQTDVLSPTTKNVLELAVNETRYLKVIGTGELLIGCMYKPTAPLVALFQQLKIEPIQIIDRTRALIRSRSAETNHVVQPSKFRDSWWYRFTAKLSRLAGIEPLPPSDQRPFDPLADDSKAVDQFEAMTVSLHMYPDSFSLRIHHGDLLFNQKQFAAAIEDYDKAVQLRPHAYPHLYCNRGLARCNLKDFDNALIDFDEALRLDPKFNKVHQFKGRAYQEKEDFEQALVAYNESLRVKPDDPITLNGRAYVYFYLWNFDKALSDHQRVLQLEPNNATALHGCGTIYAYQGRYVEAEQDFQKLLILCPNTASAHGNMAWLNLLKGDYDAALKAGEESLKYSTEYGAVYYSIGAALAAKGDHEGAVANYKKSLLYWKNLHLKPLVSYDKKMREYIAQWE